jgi:hypothetical protein
MCNSENPLFLPPGHPVAARKTVQTIQDEEGQVIKIDPVNFGIQSSADSTLLLPLNLPEDCQQEGLKIKFSGSVKEVNPNELMAGQPIVLTALHKQ